MSDFLVTMSDSSYWRFMMISVLVISGIAAGVLIPQILLIAFRKNLFDEPDERKIHHSTVPRLGGMAFEPVILFSIFIMMVIDFHSYRFLLTNVMSQDVLPLSICLCSLILLYLVGIADDLIGVKYSAKFIVQIACGLLFLFGGLYINNLHGLLFVDEMPCFIFWPFTIVLVVFIINAMNLIDGIDGLASGLSAVALAFYGIVFYYEQLYTYALVASATLGTVIPFFYYNVFGKAEKQRKIFMGDTGSLTIGLILAFLSFRLSQINPSQGYVLCLKNVHPMILAFSPLIIPCLDVVRVFFHRTSKGTSPFMPDRSHIHHKLLFVGMSQHAAMITILLSSVVFIALNVILSKYINSTLLFLGWIGIYTLINIMLTRKIHQKNIEY